MIGVKVSDNRTVGPRLYPVREQRFAVPDKVPCLAVVHELLQPPGVDGAGSLQDRRRDVINLRHLAPSPTIIAHADAQVFAFRTAEGSTVSRGGPRPRKASKRGPPRPQPWPGCSSCQASHEAERSCSTC